MSKFAELSASEIERKVESGDFKRDEVVVRDNSSGQIVRLEKNSKHNSDLFPNTFIQVNNNFIYQFDIKEVLLKIKEQKLSNDFDALEVEYNTLLDFIEMHDEIDDFTSAIHTSTITLSRKLESKVALLTKELDLTSDESVDRLISIIKAYVNVIFSYAVFLFIKSKSNQKVKSVIDKKILSVRNIIVPLYKELLMPMKEEYDQYARKYTTVPNLENSLYIKHFTGNDYEIKNTDYLVDFDDRYGSIIDVFELWKDNNFTRPQKTDDCYSRRNQKRDNSKHVVYSLYQFFVDSTKIEEFICEVEGLDLSNEELKEKIFSRLTVN